MNVRMVDKTGRNFFICEIGFHVPSLVEPFKKWFHVKRFDIQRRFNRWKYGRLTQSGRGTFVWRNGAWVPGHAVDTSIWHSFFDYGLGRVVDGSRTIKDHEKEGFIYTTHAEAERECAKRQFQKKMEYRQKLKKSIEQSLQEVASGKRSYAREHLDQMPKDMRLRHERALAARTLSR